MCPFVFNLLYHKSHREEIFFYKRTPALGKPNAGVICTFSYLKLAVFFCIVETKFKCFFVVGDKFSFTAFEYMSECVVHAFYFDCACCANNCTQHYQVSQFGAAESVCCDSVSRNRIYFYAFFNIQMICCAKVSIDNQRAAFFYNMCKFIQGRLVQSYNAVSIFCDNGRTDTFVGDDYVYVSSCLLYTSRCV